MNLVVLTGRLTKDATTRKFGEGANAKMVLSSTVAVDRPYTSKQDGKDADFFQFEVGIKEESKLPQYLLKGTQVSVTGQMRQDSFKDEEGNGVNRSVKVVSSKIEILSSKSSSTTQANTSNQEVKPQNVVVSDSKSDIPGELDL